MIFLGITWNLNFNLKFKTITKIFFLEMASDDEDYVGSGSKYDSLQLDPEDPKPSLLERKDAEKRTSSPSIKSDMPKPRFERGQTLYCYDGPDLYPVSCQTTLRRQIIHFRLNV